MKTGRLILAAILLPFGAQGGEVIVSIKPLHSLVAAVMAGDGQVPFLLVDGQASPHDYALRPSQMRALERADVVFTIGAGMETFLDNALQRLPPAAIKVTMTDAPGVTLLPMRADGGFEAHADAHGGDAADPHVWLSIGNARAMTLEIARRLTVRKPDLRHRYTNNARAILQRMDALDEELKRTLEAARNRPFIVLHDATQYFESAYGLTSIGSITHLEQPPGARHLSRLQERIAANGKTCVFHEPSFGRNLAQALLPGDDVKDAELDPEATQLEAGPELYFNMMRKLAVSFARCLA